MFGGNFHVRRDYPSPLFYAGLNGVGKHKGNSDNAGTAAPATPPFFNAGEKGETTGGGRNGGWLIPYSTSSFAPQHIKRGDENSATIFAGPTQSLKHIQGGRQRKVAQFPLLLLPPMTVPFVRPTTQQEVRYFPVSPSLSAFPPMVRLSPHLHYLEACAECRWHLLNFWFNLLLVRYHPIHHFSPNDL